MGQKTTEVKCRSHPTISMALLFADKETEAERASGLPRPPGGSSTHLNWLCPVLLLHDIVLLQGSRGASRFQEGGPLPQIATSSHAMPCASSSSPAGVWNLWGRKEGGEVCPRWGRGVQTKWRTQTSPLPSVSARPTFDGV